LSKIWAAITLRFLQYNTIQYNIKFIFLQRHHS
jgi:hypothetical protein